MWFSRALQDLMKPLTRRCTWMIDACIIDDVDDKTISMIWSRHTTHCTLDGNTTFLTAFWVVCNGQDFIFEEIYLSRILVLSVSCSQQLCSADYIFCTNAAHRSAALRRLPRQQIEDEMQMIRSPIIFSKYWLIEPKLCNAQEQTIVDQQQSFPWKRNRRMSQVKGAKTLLIWNGVVILNGDNIVIYAKLHITTCTDQSPLDKLIFRWYFEQKRVPSAHRNSVSPKVLDLNQQSLSAHWIQ